MPCHGVFVCFDGDSHKLITQLKPFQSAKFLMLCNNTMTTYHKQDEFDTLRNELESGQYYIDNQTNIHNFDYKQSRKSMVTQKWNS